ncbi:hypothetical protein PPERSA_12792 [Pseudocohnilembus persalinus]|uniref:RING-type domain-containing protein n=1 Tax=Pseudocohnilembus persalinus TaxID=266149 RepID=A0A0V0QEH2_PSEPJ|nr:hypothetical protein PPERSA_12792 [Pseudocohnilembus persalinus]|eukprot:KRX00573.1 hypothetical protein PPERSA_12792 [Pseudocohnilembus persalinus]
MIPVVFTIFIMSIYMTFVGLVFIKGKPQIKKSEIYQKKLEELQNKIEKDKKSKSNDYSSIVIKCTIVDKFSEIEHNPVFFASYQEQTVNEDRVQKNIEQNNIDYPNYEVNSFITKNDTYQIKFSEEIIKEYIEYLDTSKSNQKPIIIFSMYAASTVDDKNLNFQLKINQESTSNKNQEWVIILWFCIGIVVFLSLTLFCIYLCYRNKSFVGTNDNLRQVVPQENGRKLLKVMITQVSIEKYMPFMPYSEILENVPELSDQTECIVCLLNFSPEEQCRLTVCFHIFHKQCLDTWVKKNGNCPFCRHGLTRKIFENKQKLYTEFENNTFAQKILEKTIQNQTQDNQYEYEDEEEIEQTNMEQSIQYNQLQQSNITQIRPLNVQESEQVEQIEQEEGKFNNNNIDDNSNNNISNNDNINYSSYNNIQNQQQQFIQMGNLANLSSTRSFKLQNSNGKQKFQVNNDIQNLDTQDVSSSRQESFYKRMKSFDFLFDKSLIRSTSVKQKNKQFISKSPHKLYKSQLSTKAFSLDQGQNGKIQYKKSKFE